MERYSLCNFELRMLNLRISTIFDFQTGMRPSSCMELGHRSQF